MSKKIYTVSQINAYVRELFGQDFLLRSVQVSGEVGDCKYHGSGHIYFTLKDEKGTLSAVMFAGDRGGLKFRLEKGQSVVVTGRVGVYEAQSKYQLYAKSIEPAGQGELYRRFEELKKELEELGLFDPMYKQPIPEYVKTIGVVTAPEGAAIRDIVRVAGERNPYVQIILYPSLVQGPRAAASIARGIAVLDSMGLDVLIVGRGGGSMEELWPFNEREVCEAVFNASTPIISAVGHETDFSLCDFAADLRVPTPTAAANEAVFKIADLDAALASASGRLKDVMESRIDRERHRVARMQIRLARFDPGPVIDQLKMRLSEAENRLNAGMERKITDRRMLLSNLAARLDAASPLARLKSGFAYVDSPDGKRVTEASQVRPGDEVRVRFRDGTVLAEAKEVIH